MNSPYAWGGMLGDTRKQAAKAYFMYVEDASADARSKDPICVTSVSYKKSLLTFYQKDLIFAPSFILSKEYKIIVSLRKKVYNDPPIWEYLEKTSLCRFSP